MVETALEVEIQVDQTNLEYVSFLYPFLSQVSQITYLFNVALRAAVDPASGAALAQKTVEQVAEGQKTTVAVLVADNTFVALANGLSGVTVAAIRSRHGQGSGEEKRGDEELHCGWLADGNYSHKDVSKKIGLKEKKFHECRYHTFWSVVVENKRWIFRGVKDVEVNLGVFINFNAELSLTKTSN